MNKLPIIRTKDVCKCVMALLLVSSIIIISKDLMERMRISEEVLPTKYEYKPSQKAMQPKMNGPEVHPDSPELIKLIRERFLVPPPPPEETYQLKEPHIKDPSKGQSTKILNLLKNKTGGFFVECGGLDGEIRSNTLHFERFLGWKGLVIEADPSNFQQMLKKKRRAWLSPTCLSIQKYPMLVEYEQNFNTGHIRDPLLAYLGTRGAVEVQCLPLYSLLLALNQTKVDYFSLDVEGHELPVLRSIPFDLVDIQTLSVEFIHGVEGKSTMRKFMEEKGYIVDSEVTDPGGLANDFIFVKKSKLRS